jgi:hypothetical protein
MNAHRHRTMLEAKTVAEAWRQDYNANHPHSRMGNRTPEEFLALYETSQPPLEITDLMTGPIPGVALFPETNRSVHKK